MSLSPLNKQRLYSATITVKVLCYVGFRYNHRMELKPVLNSILEDYALPMGGDHGVAHWARVLENGLRLAEETGANAEVVWGIMCYPPMNSKVMER